MEGAEKTQNWGGAELVGTTSGLGWELGEKARRQLPHDARLRHCWGDSEGFWSWSASPHGCRVQFVVLKKRFWGEESHVWVLDVERADEKVQGRRALRGAAARGHTEQLEWELGQADALGEQCKAHVPAGCSLHCRWPLVGPRALAQQVVVQAGPVVKTAIPPGDDTDFPRR